MMRHYETIYIINPNLADDNYKSVIAKFNEIIERHKGIILEVQEWGTQRMAYDVRKFDKGSYVLVEFCADAGLTSDFERDLKLDDRILLFQTVKLADSADPQELLRMKEELARKKQPAEEPAASGEGTVQEKKAAEQGPAPEQAVATEETENQVKEEVENGNE